MWEQRTSGGPTGWTGHRFHLGAKQEAYDAEAYAIYRALCTFGEPQESARLLRFDGGHRQDLDRHPRPGAAPSVAASEVCSRIAARDNEATVKWVQAHSTTPGNEKADEFSKPETSRSAPREGSLTSAAGRLTSRI